mmetsp:Transcript_79081/g.219739  ORF Transcript_79081/g.219739 Transcript_79081/m.219739 type:complete len:338 (-) Transcript_79081:60-1073(-)
MGDAPHEDDNEGDVDADEDEDDDSAEEANPQDGADRQRVPEDQAGLDAPQNSEKPRPPKSPSKVERDDRLEANFALYEKLSNEELEKIVPKLPTGGTTSIGAILHPSGGCAACIFFRSNKGCYNGIRCKFCHGDHPKPPRRKKAARQQADGEDGEAAVAANAGGDAAPGDGAQRRKKRRRGEGGGGGAGASAGGGEGGGATETHKNEEVGDSDSMLLDEAGNSRPCWLHDDASYGVHVYMLQASARPLVAQHWQHYALPASPHGCGHEALQHGHAQQYAYATPHGYPPQGYAAQGYPPLGYPPQGYPLQSYPPQGYAPAQSHEYYDMRGLSHQPIAY